MWIVRCGYWIRSAVKRDRVLLDRGCLGTLAAPLRQGLRLSKAGPGRASRILYSNPNSPEISASTWKPLIRAGNLARTLAALT